MPKRSADDHVSMNKQPRQDPVSCEFCRGRKLKCNRKTPCSNCQARHIDCSLLTAQSQQTSAIRLGDNENELAIELSQLKEQVKIQDMRLRRLENDSQSVKIAGRSEQELALNVTDPNVNYLESLIAVRARRPNFKANILTVGDDHDLYSKATAALPAWEVANQLLQFYCDKISYLYHIVHIPSLKAQVKQLYASIDAKDSFDLAHLGVLYSVLYVSGRFWPPEETFAQIRSLESLDTWLSSAKLALSQDSLSLSLYALQARCIIALYVPAAVVNSSEYSLLGLIDQAKQLKLHILDSQRVIQDRRMSLIDHLDLEISRRIWWHMVTSDWFASFSNGPQEFTYTIQPGHMKTNLPSHSNDVEGGFEMKGEKEASDMSYLFQRIKMAEICKDIADLMAKTFDGSAINYNDILRIDLRMKDMFLELPAFFKLEPEGLALDLSSTPKLLWQRAMVHSGYHSRRIRLHRPALLRGERNSALTQSYAACVGSAFRVIEIHQELDVEPKGLMMGTVVNHIFIATLTLFIDISTNGRSDEKVQAISNAGNLLQRAKHASVHAENAINEMLKTFQNILPPQNHNFQEASLPHHAALGLENPLGSELDSTQEAPFLQENNQTVQNMFLDLLESDQMMDMSMWESVFNDTSFWL